MVWRLLQSPCLRFPFVGARARGRSIQRHSAWKSCAHCLHVRTSIGHPDVPLPFLTTTASMQGSTDPCIPTETDMLSARDYLHSSAVVLQSNAVFTNPCFMVCFALITPRSMLWCCRVILPLRQDRAVFNGPVGELLCSSLGKSLMICFMFNV